MYTSDKEYSPTFIFAPFALVGNERIKDIYNIRANTNTKFTPRRNVKGEDSLTHGRPRRRGAPGFGRSTWLSGSYGSYGLLICVAGGVGVEARMVVQHQLRTKCGCF